MLIGYGCLVGRYEDDSDEVEDENDEEDGFEYDPHDLGGRGRASQEESRDEQQRSSRHGHGKSRGRHGRRRDERPERPVRAAAAAGPPPGMLTGRAADVAIERAFAFAQGEQAGRAAAFAASGGATSAVSGASASGASSSRQGASGSGGSAPPPAAASSTSAVEPIGRASRSRVRAAASSSQMCAKKPGAEATQAKGWLQRRKHIEAKSTDDGFETQWYDAEVLKFDAKGGSVQVKFNELIADEESGAPVIEDLPLDHVRPVPPPFGHVLGGGRRLELPEWRSQLTTGEAVECYTDDAWWDAVYVSRRQAGGSQKFKVQYLFEYTGDGGTKDAWIDPECVRPRWCFGDVAGVDAPKGWTLDEELYWLDEVDAKAAAEEAEVPAAAEELLPPSLPQPPQPEVQQLMELGFAQADVESALAAAGGDVDRAASTLMDGGATASGSARRRPRR